MKRVSRLKGLVRKPLQKKYLSATQEERVTLESLIESESERRIEKLAQKGYQLEARVAGVYGLFTRGVARGTTRIVSTEKAVVAS